MKLKRKGQSCMKRHLPADPTSIQLQQQLAVTNTHVITFEQSRSVSIPAAATESSNRSRNIILNTIPNYDNASDTNQTSIFITQMDSKYEITEKVNGHS